MILFLTMFNKVKQLSVSQDATRVFVFETIEGRPSVRVAPATQNNPAYLNAVLKDKSIGRRRGLSVEVMKENRDKDRGLYAKFIIKGWENPALKDDGSAATSEDIQAFLEALPDDLFDELRTYCGEPANFRSSETDDLAKN